ncbi:unnamed protein product [Paramecium primaurelia]|uniref:BPL/LPL catalytic domain-containing protein n=1 Tax=Paramecium primaurelia TaxID=5886 RepID=A0A8S1K7E1_PARPR|nr:unnamed protein product [Paramecium primaurelia]
MNNKQIVDILFDEIDSTQTYAIQQYSTLFKDQITAIRALFQTNGRGQYNRKWESQSKRNILCTIIFPFFKNFQSINTIPLIVAHSILQVYNNLYDLNGHIKWFNDIYFFDKKQAGILVQSEITGQDVVIFIGVGINIDWNIENGINIEKILNKQINVQELYDQLKEKIVQNLFLLNEHGFKVFQNHINQQLYKKGEKCVFINQESKFVCEGTLEEINSDGMLIIREANGLNRVVDINLKMMV